MKKLTLLLLILIILFSCNSDEKIEYSVNTKNNIVNNVTKWDQVTYYSHFALDKLNVDNVTVVITHIPPNLLYQYEQQNTDVLEGFVVEISLNRYQILLNNNLSDMDVKRVIFHEFIHLKQNNSGRLVNCNNEMAEFDGKKYYIDYVPYRFRPWESEAFKYQSYLVSLSNYYK